MHKLMLAAAVALLVLGAQDAPAMPGMGGGAGGGSRFDAMDTDKNGSLSQEEFKKAFPNMTDAAFKTIDADGNGGISHEEWADFMRQHAMGKAGVPRGGMPPAGNSAAPGGLPLVTPPSGK